MGTVIQAGHIFSGGTIVSIPPAGGDSTLYYLVSSHLPSDYAVYLYDSSGNELVRIPKPNDASDSWGNNIGTNDTKIAITDNDGNGALYIYDMDGSNMVKVTSSDASGNDRFGSQLEINSTKIVVGAPYAGPIHQQGSVYVYDLDGTNEVKITASDGAYGDQFSTWGGLSVSESKIFVGSGNHDNKRGALYIYDMDGSNEVKVQSSDNAQNDEFGYIVVASETKVVATAAGSGAHGAAYIFDHDGTNEVKVEPSVDSRNNAFGGASAAINDTHVAIADRAFNGQKGAIYIYNIDGSNEVRIEHPSHFAAYDYFGYNLAMSSSKVFTCPPNDDDGGSSTGNVYEYNLDGTGERTLPTPSTFAAGSRFGQGLHIYDSSLVPSAPIFRAPPSLAEPYVIQDDISTNPPSINTSYGFYPVDEAAGHTINDNSFLNYGNQTGSIFLQKGDWTVVGDSTGNDEDSYLDIYYQNEKNNKTYAWNHSTDILGGGQGVTNRIRPVSTILTETHIFVTTVLYTSPNTTTIFKVNLSSGVVEGTYVFSNFNSSTTAGIYISDDVIYLPSNNAIARYDISSNTQLSTWSESHIAGSGYMNGKFNNGFDVKGDTIVAVADWNSSASFPNTGDGKEHVIAIDKNTGVRKWGIRYTGISGTIHWTGYPFEGLHLLGDDKVSILTFINGVYTPLVYDIPTDTVSNLIGTLNDGQNNSTKYVDIRTIGDYLLILAQYNNSHMKKLHWYHKDDLTTPVMTTGIGLITNTQDLTGGGYAQHGIFVQDDLKLHYLNKPDGSGTHNSGTKVDVWEFTLSGTTITDSHPTFIAPLSTTTSYLALGDPHYKNSSNQSVGGVYIYNQSDMSAPVTILEGVMYSDSGINYGIHLGSSILLTDTHVIVGNAVNHMEDSIPFNSSGKTPQIMIWSLDDLSSPPTTIFHPDGASAARFGSNEGEMITMDDKLFVFGHSDGVSDYVIYVYDLTDLSVNPIEITPPNLSGWNIGSFGGSFDIDPVSKKLYVGAWSSAIDGASYGTSAYQSGLVLVYDVSDLSSNINTSIAVVPTPSDIGVHGGFGSSIRYHSDKLFIGNVAQAPNGGPRVASLRVYDTSDLSLIQKFDAENSGQYGWGTDFAKWPRSLDVSDNGVVIGVPKASPNEDDYSTGEVFVIPMDSSGNLGTLTKLSNSGLSVADGDQLGEHVTSFGDKIYATHKGSSGNNMKTVEWSWSNLSSNGSEISIVDPRSTFAHNGYYYTGMGVSPVPSLPAFIAPSTTSITVANKILMWNSDYANSGSTSQGGLFMTDAAFANPLTLSSETPQSVAAGEGKVVSISIGGEINVYNSSTGALETTFTDTLLDNGKASDIWGTANCCVIGAGKIFINSPEYNAAGVGSIIVVDLLDRNVPSFLITPALGSYSRLGGNSSGKLQFIDGKVVAGTSPWSAPDKGIHIFDPDGSNHAFIPTSFGPYRIVKLGDNYVASNVDNGVEILDTSGQVLHFKNVGSYGFGFDIGATSTNKLVVRRHSHQGGGVYEQFIHIYDEGFTNEIIISQNDQPNTSGGTTPAAAFWCQETLENSAGFEIFGADILVSAAKASSDTVNESGAIYRYNDSGVLQEIFYGTVASQRLGTNISVGTAT